MDRLDAKPKIDEYHALNSAPPQEPLLTTEEVCQLVTTGHDWSRLVIIGYNWSQLVTIGYLVTTGHNCSNWFQLVTNWFQLVTTGHNLLQLVTNGFGRH